MQRVHGTRVVCSSNTSANSTWPAVSQILAKAEFLNPGGSVKDRVALTIVKEAIDAGDLKPGGLITEGTAGSTGVLSLCSSWRAATQSAAANVASACVWYMLYVDQAPVAACQHQGAQKFEMCCSLMPWCHHCRYLGPC